MRYRPCLPPAALLSLVRGAFSTTRLLHDAARGVRAFADDVVSLLKRTDCQRRQWHTELRIITGVFGAMREGVTSACGALSALFRSWLSIR